MDMKLMTSLFKKFLADTAATAAAEFTLIFPLLMTMLMGLNEVGTGVMINQKSIAAAQIVADLIARNSTVNDTVLDQAIQAGKLALDPYNTQDLGFDVVSIQFDKNNNPQEVWRHTVNMAPNNDGINRSAGLGVSGDGVLAVTVTYNYRPPLSSYIVSSIGMEEIAFSRGRNAPVIGKE
jgi:Flp pilus assembly protein TadG